MRFIAAVLALVVLAACGSSTSAPRPTPSTSSGPTPSSAIKPALAGLLSRDGPPPAAYTSVMGGFVVNVHWSDIQPEANGPIAADNAIDQAIATLHQIDPSGKMGLKLRLFAGIYAPDWAKSIDGPRIPIRDPATGASGTVGRFWSAGFGAAYADLMSKLAAKYDSVPEVREITISRCTTAYAEPFIRDAGDAATVNALLQAGFTVSADESCLREEIDAHAVWVRTRSDLAFNPYQRLDGGRRGDEAFTESMMDYCRATLGARCVLENNSIRVPLQFPAMYSHIESLGPPIGFQTAVLAKVGDLDATLQTAINLGAGSVELPSGYQLLTPAAVLASYDRALAAQAPN
jgi:hypothetical protein